MPLVCPSGQTGGKGIILAESNFPAQSSGVTMTWWQKFPGVASAFTDYRRMMYSTGGRWWIDYTANSGNYVFEGGIQGTGGSGIYRTAAMQSHLADDTWVLFSFTWPSDGGADATVDDNNISVPTYTASGTGIAAGAGNIVMFRGSDGRGGPISRISDLCFWTGATDNGSAQTDLVDDLLAGQDPEDVSTTLTLTNRWLFTDDLAPSVGTGTWTIETAATPVAIVDDGDEPPHLGVVEPLAEPAERGLDPNGPNKYGFYVYHWASEQCDTPEQWNVPTAYADITGETAGDSAQGVLDSWVARGWNKTHSRGAIMIVDPADSTRFNWSPVSVSGTNINTPIDTGSMLAWFTTFFGSLPEGSVNACWIDAENYSIYGLSDWTARWAWASAADATRQAEFVTRVGVDLSQGGNQTTENRALLADFCALRRRDAMYDGIIVPLLARNPDAIYANYNDCTVADVPDNSGSPGTTPLAVSALDTTRGVSNPYTYAYAAANTRASVEAYLKRQRDNVPLLAAGGPVVAWVGHDGYYRAGGVEYKDTTVLTDSMNSTHFDELVSLIHANDATIGGAARIIQWNPQGVSPRETAYKTTRRTKAKLGNRRAQTARTRGRGRSIR